MKALSPEEFLKNVKKFEFMRDHIWPSVRKMALPYLSKRCKVCNLSENYMPLKDGRCPYCRGEMRVNFDVPDKSSSEKLSKKLDRFVKSHIGTGKYNYDALVLFSGGKDSTFLTSRIRENYPDLRIMALSVDNNFMSPIAKGNIDFVCRRLNVPLVTIKPSADYTAKAYAYAFKHIGRGGAAGTVDQLDGDLTHDIARVYAHENGIPLVFSGLSRLQVQNILRLNDFCTSKEVESKPREVVGNIKPKDFSTSVELRTYWWQGVEEGQSPPILVFPYFAWNFSESEIKKKIVDLDLGSLTTQSPILTNSELVSLMGVVDICHRGYSSFEPEFCESVRLGKSNRLTWLHTFEFLEFCAITGLFLDEMIDDVLERLNLSKEELSIAPRLQRDLKKKALSKIEKLFLLIGDQFM